MVAEIVGESCQCPCSLAHTFPGGGLPVGIVLFEAWGLKELDDELSGVTVGSDPEVKNQRTTSDRTPRTIHC